MSMSVRMSLRTSVREGSSQSSPIFIGLLLMISSAAAVSKASDITMRIDLSQASLAECRQFGLVEMPKAEMKKWARDLNSKVSKSLKDQAQVASDNYAELLRAVEDKSGDPQLMVIREALLADVKRHEESFKAAGVPGKLLYSQVPTKPWLAHIYYNNSEFNRRFSERACAQIGNCEEMRNARLNLALRSALKTVQAQAKSFHAQVGDHENPRVAYDIGRMFPQEYALAIHALAGEDKKKACVAAQNFISRAHARACREGAVKAAGIVGLGVSCIGLAVAAPYTSGLTAVPLAKICPVVAPAISYAVAGDSVYKKYQEQQLSQGGVILEAKDPREHEAQSRNRLIQGVLDLTVPGAAIGVMKIPAVSGAVRRVLGIGLPPPNLAGSVNAARNAITCENPGPQAAEINPVSSAPAAPQEMGWP